MAESLRGGALMTEVPGTLTGPLGQSPSSEHGSPQPAQVRQAGAPCCPGFPSAVTAVCWDFPGLEEHPQAEITMYTTATVPGCPSSPGLSVLGLVEHRLLTRWWPPGHCSPPDGTARACPGSHRLRNLRFEESHSHRGNRGLCC